MGFWDSLSDFWYGPSRGAVNGMLSSQTGPGYQAANPYAAQLQQMASGQGPSLAVQQYQRANSDAQNAQIAMSRGRGGGSAFTAATNLGRLGADLSAGSAEARTREQMGAIGAGSQLEQERARANQEAYLRALQMSQAQGGIGQSLAGIVGQGLSMAAMLHGGGAGAAAGGGGVGGSIMSAGQGYGGTSGPGPLGGMMGPPGFDYERYLRNGGF